MQTRRLGWSLTLVTMGVAVGCTASPSTPKPPNEHVVTAQGRPSPLSAPELSTVEGVVTAPASLIANNGSSLIGNNGSGLVGNNGSSYVVLAEGGWQPAAQVHVTVTDVFGRALDGAAATTDAHGRFRLSVPSAGTWIVHGRLGSAELSTIARPADGRVAVAVDPATTLAVQGLLNQNAQQPGAVALVPLATFDQLVGAVQQAVRQSTAPLDLSSPAATLATLAQLKSADAAVATALGAAQQSTDAAIAAAQQQASGAAPDLRVPTSPLPVVPQPTPIAATPAPSASTPASTPTPTATQPPSSPTAAPSAQASTASSSVPTATPTPTPSPTATPAASASMSPMLQQLLTTNRCGFCNLGGVDASGRTLTRADLGFADLTRANLSHAELGSATLDYATLPHADLSGADLAGANLEYADLIGANLRGANLQNADLTFAMLDNADLTGADLTGAKLMFTSTSGTQGLPAGF